MKVIDFGLAKAIATEGEAAPGETFATRGGFLGTPQFASPEQLESSEMDVRSDIYSLGVTLWYALTGELPFAGGAMAEMRDRQLHRPLPIAQLQDVHVPAPVVALLTSMLAPDPEKRPASSAVLCEEIRACLESQKPHNRVPPLDHCQRSPFSRSPLRLLSAISRRVTVARPQ